MKKRFRRNGKNLRNNHILNLILTFILLLIISTGYSILEEKLSLNGTLNIKTKKSNENAFVYNDETITYSGLTFTLDSDGYLTINGTLTGSLNLYVRVNDSIKITTDGSRVKDIFTDNLETIPGGSTIENGYQYVSGSLKKGNGDINLCLRDVTDKAIAKVPLSTKDNYINQVVDNNSIIQYLYIINGSSFTNYKVKLYCKIIEEGEIIENPKDMFNILSGNTELEGLSINVDGESGSVTIDGTARNSCYIKVSDGLWGVINTNQIPSWFNNATTIIKKNTILYLEYEYLSGTISGTSSNLCLRSTSNVCEYKYQLKTLDSPNMIDKDSLGDILSNDVGAMYLYISKGTNLSNYSIIPKIAYTAASPISTNNLEIDNYLFSDTESAQKVESNEINNEVEDDNDTKTIKNEINNSVTNIIADNESNNTSTNLIVNSSNIIEEDNNITIKNDKVENQN